MMGKERPATPAEIETGVFYKDHDDYVREGSSSMTTDKPPHMTSLKDQVAEF